MYCTRCGEKVISEEENCMKCGNPLRITLTENKNAAVIVRKVVTVSIYIESIDHELEPWVLWIGPEKSALICMSKIEKHNDEYGIQPLPGDSDTVYRSYAHGLAWYPLDRIMEAHPCSIPFDTASTRMIVYLSYSSDFDRLDDLKRFILDTPAGKFRCGFERGTDMDEVQRRMKTILGDRYITKGMERFPPA